MESLDEIVATTKRLRYGEPIAKRLRRDGMNVKHLLNSERLVPFCNVIKAVAATKAAGRRKRQRKKAIKARNYKITSGITTQMKLLQTIALAGYLLGSLLAEMPSMPEKICESSFSQEEYLQMSTPLIWG